MLNKESVAKKILWPIITLSALGLAFYFFYFPPNQFVNKLSAGIELYGYQTKLKLSSYPMEDHQGMIKTWESYSDMPLYITTGFTSCRLSCPETMKLYQNMVSKIGDKARYALLTIDPLNDTPKQLASYLEPLNPNLIGLRINNPELLRKTLDELQQVIYVSGNKDNIEHKSFVYLSHPVVSGLITYTKPDVNQMMDDLKTIEKRNINNE